MESEKAPVTVLPLTLYKYSNRVILKTILEREDGGQGLIGQRVVIGGWVKSSKEFKKEPDSAPAPPDDGPANDSGRKDVTCVEIFQSRIPFFRSLAKVFGGGTTAYPARDKLEVPSVVHKPPPPPRPSISILQVSDGSCPASLQVC